MNVSEIKDGQYIKEIQLNEIFEKLDEFELRDLCNIMSEPHRKIHSCISKGQLKTLCLQLIAENIALKKLINKQ